MYNSCTSDANCFNKSENPDNLACDSSYEMCLAGVTGKCYHDKHCASDLVCIGEGMSLKRHSEIPGTCEQRPPPHHPNFPQMMWRFCTSDDDCVDNFLSCDTSLERCLSEENGKCMHPIDCMHDLECIGEDANLLRLNDTIETCAFLSP